MDAASDVFAALDARADELQSACGCHLDRSEPMKMRARLAAQCEAEDDWPRQIEWFCKTFPPFVSTVMEVLEENKLIPPAA